MNKKQLEARLINLRQLREQHLQDVMEINFCIVGLDKQVSEMPDEEEKAE